MGAYCCLPLRLRAGTAAPVLLSPTVRRRRQGNDIATEVLPILILGPALGILGPINSTIGAAVFAFQSVIDGAMAGDPEEVLNALINAPGVLVDGLLNGGYGGFINAGIFGTTETGVAGPIEVLLTIRTAIAQALVPNTAVRAAAEETKVAAQAVADTSVRGEVINVEVATTDALADSTPPAGNAAPAPLDKGDEEPTVDVDLDELDDSDDPAELNTEDDDSTSADLTSGNKVTPGGDNLASKAKSTVNDALDKLGVERGTFGLGGSDSGAAGDSDGDADSDDGGSDAGGGDE